MKIHYRLFVVHFLAEFLVYFFVHTVQRSHFTSCGDFSRFLGAVFSAGSLSFRFFIGEQPVRQAARKAARYAGTSRLTDSRTGRGLFEIGLALLGFDVAYRDDRRSHGARAILRKRLAWQNDIVLMHRRRGPAAGWTVGGAAIFKTGAIVKPRT